MDDLYYHCWKVKMREDSLQSRAPRLAAMAEEPGWRNQGRFAPERGRSSRAVVASSLGGPGCRSTSLRKCIFRELRKIDFVLYFLLKKFFNKPTFSNPSPQR